MKKPIVWRFRAVERTDVGCPLALDQGVCKNIGKRYDPETECYVIDDDRGVVVVDKRQAASLRGYYDKVLRQGALLPADEATAAYFKLPFPSLSPRKRGLSL